MTISMLGIDIAKNTFQLQAATQRKLLAVTPDAPDVLDADVIRPRSIGLA